MGKSKGVMMPCVGGPHDGASAAGRADWPDGHKVLVHLDDVAEFYYRFGDKLYYNDRLAYSVIQNARVRDG